MNNWICLFIITVAQLIMMVPIPAEGRRSVTMSFVIDDTGSMSEEIAAVRAGVIKLVNETHKEISNYTVVRFNDPGVWTFQSTDKDEITTYVNNITASGGGDCPEMAMTALLEAIRLSEPNSLIFFFSDASAKDYIKEYYVSKAAADKAIQIYFLLTGCCYKYCTSVGYQAYKKIESKTGAKIYLISKPGVAQFMKFVIVAVLDDIKRLWYPPATFSIVVAIGERNISLTVSISAKPLLTTENRKILCNAAPIFVSYLRTYGFAVYDSAASELTDTFRATGTKFAALSQLYKEYVDYAAKTLLTFKTPVKKISFFKECKATLNSFLLYLDTKGWNSGYLVTYKNVSGSVIVDSIKNVTGYTWECPPFIPTVRMTVIDHLCPGSRITPSLLLVLLLCTAKWILAN